MSRQTVRRIGVLLIVTGVGIATATARADRVALKNGGTVRGTVVRTSQEEDGETVTVRTLTGAEVTLARRNIKGISRRPLVVEQYERRARRTPKTVEAQWDLAEWCRKQGLSSQRDECLRRIVEIDPEHEPAHRGLGHVKWNGEWTTREAIMKERGYVKYDGRYVTPQELELIKEAEAENEAEQKWFPKVHLWHSWLTGRDPDRRQKAVRKLRNIQDPHAVPALVKNLQEDPRKPVRMLFVEIVSHLPGRKAAEALVAQSLHDVDDQVRRAALNGVGEDQHEAAMPLYVRALKNDRNAVVRRAAEALERIGDQRAVPHLIAALVTTHRYRVRVPDNRKMSVSFGTDGSMANPNRVPLPPEIEGLLRTGQIPGVIVHKPKLPGTDRTKVVTVKRDRDNWEVLSALKKLTGKSFGYNESAWRRWWAAQKGQVGALPAS